MWKQLWKQLREYQRLNPLKCSWCGNTDIKKSKEGCYGSMVHCICTRYGCGHEWDIVE